MNSASFFQIKYRQTLDTCVLASYGVACFPFTGTPVLDYFTAYCRNYNQDATHPERSYENHFHAECRKPGMSGYKILKCLHDGSAEAVFEKARNAVSLEHVDWAQTDAAAIELKLKNPDCLLLLFLNGGTPPNFNRLEWHSIVVGHDGQSLFYFDTGPGAPIKGPSQLKDFGRLGDAFIVSKKV